MSSCTNSVFLNQDYKRVGGDQLRADAHILLYDLSKSIQGIQEILGIFLIAA